MVELKRDPIHDAVRRGYMGRLVECRMEEEDAGGAVVVAEVDVSLVLDGCCSKRGIESEAIGRADGRVAPVAPVDPPVRDVSPVKWNPFSVWTVWTLSVSVP
jgi:hypothetical protein